VRITISGLYITAKDGSLLNFGLITGNKTTASHRKSTTNSMTEPNLSTAKQSYREARVQRSEVRLHFSFAQKDITKIFY